MTSQVAYRLAPSVGYVDEDGGAVCHAALLPNGPPLVLRDSAAAIWLRAREGGTTDDIVLRVAEDVGLEADEIREDIETFLTELVGLRLLVSESLTANRGRGDSPPR